MSGGTLTGNTSDIMQPHGVEHATEHSIIAITSVETSTANYVPGELVEAWPRLWAGGLTSRSTPLTGDAEARQRDPRWGDLIDSSAVGIDRSRTTSLLDRSPRPLRRVGR